MATNSEELKAAERAFEREWSLAMGHRLSEQDKALARVTFCLGWLESERRIRSECSRQLESTP